MIMTNEQKLDYLKGLVGIETTDTAHNALLNSLLSLSEKIALSIIFPFAKEDDELLLPSNYQFWVVLCAKEIWDKKEIGSGLQTYSENGLSFSVSDARGLVSFGLTSMLTPKASIPR